jgi:hypothetical protein
MLTAQASGAQVQLFGLAINNQSHRMNVRRPAAFGMPFGVAYIVTELGRFAA